MGRCSVCKKFGHSSTRHRQVCAICGGDPRVIPFIEDVNPMYRCPDTARHDQIREGFGDPLIVKQAAMTPFARTKKPDKNQLKLVE